MIRLNRQSKKKLNNNSSSIKRVKFSDQILLVESIKDNDFESVKSLLKKKSSNIDINKINDSGRLSHFMFIYLMMTVFKFENDQNDKRVFSKIPNQYLMIYSQSLISCYMKNSNLNFDVSKTKKE